MRRLSAKIAVTTIAATMAFGGTAAASEVTVSSGDSLWSIGQENGVSVSELKDINNLSSDIIHAGDTLQTSSGGSSSTDEASSASNSSSGGEVTVQAGDTLSAIANREGVTVSQLQDWNNMSGTLLMVGDTLQVESSGSSGGSNDSAESTSSTGSSNGTVESYIDTAKSQMGAPYQWGGTTPAGFDCSGFVNYAIDGEGLPRTVSQMYNSLTPVSSPDRGDIVFFDTSGGPSHAGIYLGGGEFIHAGASTGVTVSNMNSGYWSNAYLGARTY
ncbi:C40 family peptidase [Salisediminibacterium halotolerans]|uniref:C40 family peptidase n=1 Tax=Salisediminibacterium halotolerans TaxID=517425 RepID=UPI000EB1C258|nr:C40 family peptidase [Salisediminibacterium halotolerans]RLJ74119.1 peptidoglycan endopeptidase LytF/peptidoglycan endopeptidase LytE [Actinophytocola xinjiangensis]RPE87788.1 peptidoglycan endopeptidase LytE [Salisediminibacterium halotolerans]TWG34956.1 peptidoglycan endopeptidase LytF/peptidoglycan endopeptidase LytE [Salisediminibacterium halotolerans]GEL07709.1 hypothetical protein SHA02_11250 [Salisediminibacterium halotolerans]